ncbi:MAG: hypothetical protein KatS3mg130_0168 [Candidatus Sumerlaea sp.]|nr:MAG: hypothetical protein KatS3mg130_0168 [Candidatus Sumerlaea sp.]
MEVEERQSTAEELTQILDALKAGRTEHQSQTSGAGKLPESAHPRIRGDSAFRTGHTLASYGPCGAAGEL